MKEIQADVTAMITHELGRYSADLVDDVNSLAEKYSKKLKNELRRTSPKKTGEYAKGWSCKQVDKRANVTRWVVYNSKKPHVTHLLENGHKTRGGTKRVAPVRHIAPAEQKILNEFADELEQIIKNGGK